jgi:membrane-bound lytic murein transglycosylase D
MKLTRAWAKSAGIFTTGLVLVGMSVSLRAGGGESGERAGAELPIAAATAAGAAGGAAAQLSGAGLGPEWDLPNLDHPRVDFWIARFDTVPDMREKFQGFLDRGGAWTPHILAQLEARNMPLDLLYLAMIESGFQTEATSHASAVGVWQFIPATGLRFGLAIDRAVDERRDPVRSTEAALDYLEFLHRRFGSWYLAAAAYNAGEGRIGRIMRQQYGRVHARSEQEYYRIWDRLPRETRDYVPLMIAAGRIAKDPEAFGFRPMNLEPREWEYVTFPPATPLARIAAGTGATLAEIRDLNPQFLLDRTPNNRDYAVRLPSGSGARLATASGGTQGIAE